MRASLSQQNVGECERESLAVRVGVAGVELLPVRFAFALEGFDLLVELLQRLVVATLCRGKTIEAHVDQVMRELALTRIGIRGPRATAGSAFGRRRAREIAR